MVRTDGLVGRWATRGGDGVESEEKKGSMRVSMRFLCVSQSLSGLCVSVCVPMV